MTMRTTTAFAALSLFQLQPCLAQYYPLPLEICDEGLVAVTSISYSCDTPLDAYDSENYHRNSATCDYGDYIAVSVNFDLLDSYGSDIYVAIHAYSANNEKLLTKKSTLSTLVGSDVDEQGSYFFSKELSLAYVEDQEGEFEPQITLAFSGGANGGDEFGGANLDECSSGSMSTISGGSGYVLPIVVVAIVLSLLVGLLAYKLSTQPNRDSFCALAKKSTSDDKTVSLGEDEERGKAVDEKQTEVSDPKAPGALKKSGSRKSASSKKSSGSKSSKESDDSYNLMVDGSSSYSM